MRIGIDAAVPGAEIADDAHAARVRRPHREADAGDAIHHANVRAELLPELAMRAFVEQMKIDVAERRQKAIRIAPLPHGAVGVVEAQAIVQRQRRARDERGVEIGQALRDAVERNDASVVEHGIRRERRRAPCARTTTPLTPSTIAGCAPRIDVRVRELAGEQAVDLVASDRCGGRGLDRGRRRRRHRVLRRRRSPASFAVSSAIGSISLAVAAPPPFVGHSMPRSIDAIIGRRPTASLVSFVAPQRSASVACVSALVRHDVIAESDRPPCGDSRRSEAAPANRPRARRCRCRRRAARDARCRPARPRCRRLRRWEA